jgi:hypothetical protein
MVNLMTIRKTIAIALFSIGLSFAAQAADATSLGPVISQAYEVSLGNFRAPGTRNGTVSFKECEECTHMTVRVTANTRYKINGRTVRLEDFRKKVAEAGNRESAEVTILHHLESDTIEQINVSF